MDKDLYDICIIGGGVNGCGIARDAAGRGYKVLLLEKGDLAQGTSSASTKLIHGGLRYLEHYEFNLVAKSLRERDVLKNLAPHIICPMNFVLPHMPHLRPLWLLRAGLWIYDILAAGTSLSKSKLIRFNSSGYINILKKNINKGVRYSDCWVEDARLVVLNAMDAQMRGADIHVNTKCEHIKFKDGVWDITASNGHSYRAQMVVNAAGPWAAKMLEMTNGADKRPLRLVKGSHIVVPRLYDADHAYILQNDDGRIVFTIPFENDFTLVGTTDVDLGSDPEKEISINEIEIKYLCDIVNQYFQKNISPSDRVWDYAGVRPLIDEGDGNASKASRDYKLDMQDINGLSFLSVLGGKLTTYRVLAEEAVDKIDKVFGNAPKHWTAFKKLPGGDIADNDMPRFIREQASYFPFLSQSLISRYAHSYGTCMNILLDGVKSLDDMGRDLGGGVYGRELDYLRIYEFARTGEDVLWRRSKLGLHLDQATQKAVDKYMKEKTA